MNKNLFIEELRSKLKRLPQEEIDNAITYYIEYFEDAGIDDEQDILEELDSPAYVASEILSDYALKEDEDNSNKSKTGIVSIWFILLSILAAPIALPIGFALILIVFTMAFVVAVLVFAFSIISIALFGIGIGSGIFGATIVFKGFATSLILIGSGFVLVATGVLFGLLVIKVTPKIFRGIADLGRNSLNKLKRNK